MFQWTVNGSSACTTTATALSNPISMNVKNVIAPTVDITASPDPVCSGMPVTFSATSNSIVMTVNPTPVIAPNQVFTATSQGVILTPDVSGDIAYYAWTPALGLSDANISNPIANPQRTVIYTLTVISKGRCTASGDITVKVYSDIRIPGAFTPNGDGKNDIFYVLGGPQGSAIKDFSIFDRWGTKVFQVHDVVPGDPAYGWNGYFKGAPAITGTYVYSLTMTLAGGKQQLFKGVVILIR